MRVDVHDVTGATAPMKIDVHVDRSEVEVRHTQLGAEVRLDGATRAGHLGGPGLPARLIGIALPPGTRAMRVSTVVRDTQALTQAPVVLAPVMALRRVPTDRTLLRRSSVHPDARRYQQEARAPRPLARLIETQMVGDTAVALIAFSPVVVAPDRSLSLAAHCEITLELGAADAAWRAGTPKLVSRAQQERGAQLARAAVVNPDHVVPGPGPRLSPLPHGVDHLILTDNHTWDAKTSKVTGTLTGDLVQAFGRLATWRTEHGLRSRVVTVSDIVNGVHGDFGAGSRDLQHTLRKFLVWAQAQWGVAHVLIGGSHRIVPARWVDIGGMEGLSPTDFHYANLGPRDDWTEGQKLDHAATDYAIHLGVGRVAVETGRQAEIFVNKVCEYESLTAHAGTPIAQDYLRRLLVCATSWNRELRIDLVASATSPPKENTYFHAPGTALALIKLHETLELTRDTPPQGQNPGTNRYTHFAGEAFSKLHLLEAATCKEVQDLAAVFADGRRQPLTYRKDAGPSKPGWYFDLDTTNFIKVFGSASELEPARYVIRLKPAFREPQNLLRVDRAKLNHLIPYDHAAPSTGLGWYFANSGTDLTPSAVVAGLPTPTAWVVVRDQAAHLDSAHLDRLVFDPTTAEGSMADQEVLRQQIARDLPEWEHVHRLYEDQFDLPARDRSEPPVQQFNVARFREQVGIGQHLISLSGHGWAGGCCNGIDRALADTLMNGACHSIVYADSCLTARFTDDALATHFVLNPTGGAVAYVGYTAVSYMGLSKFFQQQFFRGLAQGSALGIAFDSRGQLLQPGYWDFDPTSDDPRRMILIGSLAGDPAMALTRCGDHAVRTADGHCLSATAGGSLGHDAVRTDALLCGPWETFTLVPQGGGRYALRTVDGHHLTMVGGGGRSADAVHSNQAGIGAHEAVRLVPWGAGAVSLGTPDGHFVTAVSKGGLAAQALRTDAVAVGPAERFTLEPRQGAGLAVALKTAAGRFVTAVDGGGRKTDVLHSNATAVGPWEKFVLVPLGPTEHALRTRDGHFLTAVNGGGRTTDAVHTDATRAGPWERFTLVPQGEGRLALQTCNGQFLTFMGGGGKATDVVHTNATSIGPWEVLTVVAEVAFRTSGGRCLTAENGGGMAVDAIHTDATEVSVHERFSLVPMGPMCALQTPDGHWLGAVGGGGRTTDVLHSDAVAVGPWERFTIVPLPGRQVALRTIDGHCLTAMEGGGRHTDVVHSNAVAIGPWEQFTLVAQGGGRFALKTASGHFLTVVGGGGRRQDAVHTDAPAAGPHEALLVMPLAGQRVALRTAKGRFVTAVGGGGRTQDAVHTDASTAAAHECFNVVPLAAGRCALQTMNGTFVTAVGGGGKTVEALHTDARAIGPWEVFALVD